ncbi:hypothetical protein CLU79DRAFT_751087 [Phycomyces nitens]|nr:hypothetical protein CLU79DRAFT_751087 [Phycomyces nitens]
MLSSMAMMQPEQTDQYYYMNSAVYQRQPLQYHLYSAPPTRMPKLAPNQKTIKSLFMPDDLREQLTERNEKVLTIGSSHDQSLPQEVHIYHSLSLLDDMSANGGKFFGHASWVYKAVCSVDGRSYVLVRIADFRLANELAMSMVENWKRIRHCNVVAIREAFATSAFDDSSLVFVYDYHPCSETLQHVHLSSQTQSNFQRQPQIKTKSSPHVPESTLWSYITQIASALKSIHSLGLAARVLDPTKILVTGRNRIRLSCVSIADVLQFDGGQSLSRHQQEDLLAFGKLIVALACNSTHSIQNLSQSFEYISRFYSPDLKNTILYLLSKPMPTKTIDEVVSLIGPYILQEINGNHSYNDTLENELSRELENARLVRIMSKMAFINERPVFDMDPSWSETGDRYIIKLFRDYVFHQVDAKGTPVVDMVHVITCLNKLDAGVDEKIMLMSRDEQSCLVVSYKEVKNCIINAFNDLTSGRK